MVGQCERCRDRLGVGFVGEREQGLAELRDGVLKRGTTWPYMVGAKDPETGQSRPRWVGGFATEDDAKAARGEARVKAHCGEYIDRKTITVREYLAARPDGADRWQPHRPIGSGSTGRSSFRASENERSALQIEAYVRIWAVGSRTRDGLDGMLK